MQLVDHRGLADARIAGHEHQLRGALGHDPVEGGEQRLDLALAPVQFLGDQQPVGHILRAEREIGDAALDVPLGQAAAQIGLQPGGGLVALLCGLGEQLHYDRRDGFGNAGQPHGGRERLSRDMAVHPFQGIGRRERQ